MSDGFYKFVVETGASSKTPMNSVAKRYRPSSAYTGEAPAFILVFTHATGFFKEQWDLVIEALYKSASHHTSVRIREVWALDAQTHGESAALNEDIMANEEWELTMEDCAEVCANLYNNYIGPGRRPHDRVIYIGHSAGSVCALLSTSLFQDRAPYDACVLVEPAMWTKDLVGQNTPFFDMAVQSLPKRREHWKSWEDMREYTSSRMPWNMWDQRALDLYLKFAFKDDEKRGGVTLKCLPKHEATAFKNVAVVANVVTVLDKTCKYMPVHLIFGENNDLVSLEQQESLLRDGRKFASITRIPECGHMVVQENPDAVTQAIWNILADMPSPIPKNKL